jgi:hypothetical protein
MPIIASQIVSSESQNHLEHFRNVVLDTFLALNRKTILAKLNSGCTASVVLVVRSSIIACKPSLSLRPDSNGQLVISRPRLTQSVSETSGVIQCSAISFFFV